MSTAPFGIGGRLRKPRTCIEDVPRIGVGDLKGVAAVPLTPRAREEVHVVINGRPEVVEVVRDPRHYGGDGQRYFLCPGCSRKVWHLYLRDERLACRRCARLDYRSKHTRQRGLNRVLRLREKIGAPAGLLSSIPPKPRGWRKDYWTRRLAALAAAEASIAAKLHAMIPRVRRRLRHDRHRAPGT